MEKNIHAQRYLISSENLSYREVINNMADSFGKPRPSIHVGKVLTEIGWRAEAARKLFSRTKPMITKETARNGQCTWLYSNEKVKKETGINFIPVKEGIRNACEIFLKEIKAD
jgi:dihydroflavonol-4-reductase